MTVVTDSTSNIQQTSDYYPYGGSRISTETARSPTTPGPHDKSTAERPRCCHYLADTEHADAKGGGHVDEID
jgi:hypothetical protein